VMRLRIWAKQWVWLMLENLVSIVSSSLIIVSLFDVLSQITDKTL
jgi:hypothetical protein